MRIVINLNNGHTPRSPGGVFGGRTEYKMSERLIGALYSELSAMGLSGEIRLTEGTDGIKESGDDGLLLVFHKGTHMKNEKSSGAGIFVGEGACARTQYKAYRMLCSLCGDRGFRYRGVHPLTHNSPFKTFSEYAPEDAFIISAGYIDNPRDCLTEDKELRHLASGLSQIIAEIYKEKKNEDYS